jgi:hypothetical protein
MAISKINSKSIEDGIISADDLAAGSISTAKIADSAVTAAKINDGDISTAKIADSAITAAKITDGAVTNSKITGNVNFKNIVINGDMSIAQRSTSVASITTTGYYTVDRWQTAISSLGTWTQSQSTDVPTGQGFAKSLKMDCTTADASPSASDSLYVRTKFEGQNLQYLKKGTASALSLTASFWVKSNKTGTYIVELFDNDNSDFVSQSYTINVANTWEKKTVIFPADTTSAFDNDNAVSLGIHFYLGAGTDITSGTLNSTWTDSAIQTGRAVGQVNLADDTANEWYITGVQLEAGTTASDFEFLPVDVNLNRCLRYYQKISGIIGTAGTTTQVYTSTPFSVEMRASPTLSVSSAMVFSDVAAADYTQSSGSATINGALVNARSVNAVFANFTGMTTFRPMVNLVTNSLLLSAEL